MNDQTKTYSQMIAEQYDDALHRIAELETMLATRDEAEKRLQYLTELSAKSAHRQLDLEAALRNLLNSVCANPEGCTTPAHSEAWHALTAISSRGESK